MQISYVKYEKRQSDLAKDEIALPSPPNSVCLQAAAVSRFS